MVLREAEVDGLLQLSEMEHEDVELVPEILPVDARLSIRARASDLIDMLQRAVEVTPAKEIIPLTGSVQVEAVIGSVTITATDGERTVSSSSTSCQVALAGTSLMPGKKVLNILKLVPDSVVKMDVLGESTTIRAGRAVWNVSTPSVHAKLPTFTSLDNMEYHALSRRTLLKALENVYPAISKTSARQSLMQVHVHKGKITACDGVRTHRAIVEGLPKAVNTTLPLRFVETAIRELKASDEEAIEFGSSNSAVSLRLAGTVIASQRLNFEYPDVDYLMLGPALSNDEELTFDVSEVIQTIKRVRVNADPDFLSIHLALRESADGWNLTFQARDKSGNSSQETVPVTFVGASKAKDIALNHRYLTEFLGSATSDTVTLKLGESTKTKQAPVYMEDGDFLGSLMPMASNIVR